METTFVHSAGGRSSAPGTRDGSITVTELIDRYMADYGGRDGSLFQRLEWWRARIGSMRLIEVDDDTIFHCIEDLSRQRGRYYAGKDADGRPVMRAKDRPVANSTLNRYQSAAGSLFGYALKKRLAPKGWSSPTLKLGARPENNERVRFLSDEERERLFAACRSSKWPMMFAAVLLAIVTGARKGELMRLRWRDADLDAGVIVVPGKTKNNDNKTLVLTANAVEELRKHVGRAEALIFASRITPDKPFNFAASAWPRALRQANIRNLKWHDLRHTCASYLAQSGATLLQIADVLGHRNLSVTRRYSHLTVGHRRKLVDDVLGGLK